MELPIWNGGSTCFTINMEGMEKMKIHYSLFMIAIIVLLVACTNSNNDQTEDQEVLIYSEIDSEKITLEEWISTSNVALMGEFRKKTEYVSEGFVEYEFYVNEILYGYVPEDNISVNSAIGRECVTDNNGYEYSYEPHKMAYVEGKEYLLILEAYEQRRNDSFLYVQTDLMICPEDDIYTMYNESIEIREIEQLKNYIIKMKELDK